MDKGYYKAKVVYHEFGEASTGSKYIQLTFEICEGEKYEHAQLRTRRYFTDKTAEHTVRDLRTCGWVGDDLKELKGLGDNLVSLAIEDKEYNDKVFPEVRWINPVFKKKDYSLPDEVKISDDDLVVLSAEFKSIAMAAEPPQGVEKATKDDIVEDDLPF